MSHLLKFINNEGTWAIKDKKGNIIEKFRLNNSALQRKSELIKEKMFLKEEIKVEKIK